jgi:putative ATPase
MASRAPRGPGPADGTDDLFARRLEGPDAPGAPLAERMRPRRLEDIIGQDHLLAPGRFLREAIARGRLPSLILWGPPGSGKTTIARALAAEVSAEFVAFSAVGGTVKEVREIFAEARRRLAENGRRTILFVDEIHRFSKAQQDAFLPHVERGTVTLVGATTENPSFEVIAPLLSRCKVVQLRPLAEQDVRRVVERALADRERGLGGAGVRFEPEALAAIAAASAGDARKALTTAEVAVELAAARAAAAGPSAGDETVGGRVPPAAAAEPLVDRPVVEEALQHKTLLYDRAGDAHYDTVSAFIKSMRGSDPDAALHYLARMVESGEDPLFICRRMVIFAAEDVGNADPMGLLVANAVTDAVRFVGMPEGFIPLAQGVTYLASAPKSNASYRAYLAARADVQAQGPLPVPLHLRNAPTGLMKGLGYGAGYQYPHDHEGGHVADAQYLPDALRGRRYYAPTEHGHERRIAERLRRWRGDPEPGDGQDR